MKTKLLRKLRNEGRNMINVYSITTTIGVVTGMSYGYSSPDYRGLFSFGDTEEDVREKAMRIYMEKEVKRRREKRRKRRKRRK